MAKNIAAIFLIFSAVACSMNRPPQVPIVSADPKSYRVETLVADIDGVPWSMAMLDSKRVLITLRQGRFKLLNLVTKRLSDVTPAPSVYGEGQGGLLDVAGDPDFAHNQLIYYTYAVSLGTKQATRLARAKLVGAKLQQQKVLFTGVPALDSTRHFGARIAFDDEGFMFVSMGERGQRAQAQKLDNHYGKILRFKRDGSVPADNPFVAQKGAQPEIWSYGHRNPQGLFFDRTSGKLWVNEHGPRGGDEINLIKKAANYAWPLATYGREYWGPRVSEHATYAGTQNPRHVWLPSIAPSDLLVYRGDAFVQWRGSFLSGALALTHLNRVTMKGDKSLGEERLLLELGQRIRSLAVDSVGAVLVGTDDGAILRLLPARSK